MTLSAVATLLLVPPVNLLLLALAGFAAVAAHRAGRILCGLGLAGLLLLALPVTGDLLMLAIERVTPPPPGPAPAAIVILGGDVSRTGDAPAAVDVGALTPGAAARRGRPAARQRVAGAGERRRDRPRRAGAGGVDGAQPAGGFRRAGALAGRRLPRYLGERRQQRGDAAGGGHPLGVPGHARLAHAPRADRLPPVRPGRHARPRCRSAGWWSSTWARSCRAPTPGRPATTPCTNGSAALWYALRAGT